MTEFCAFLASLTIIGGVEVSPDIYILEYDQPDNTVGQLFLTSQQARACFVDLDKDTIL